MILPQGRLNIIDFPWIATIAEKGRDERSTWQLSWSGSTGPRHRFDPVWDMVLEGSTGFSGAFARQVTVSLDNFKEQEVDSTSAPESPEYSSGDLMAALKKADPTRIGLKDYHNELISAMEESSKQGAVVLEVDGAFLEGARAKKIELQYANGVYVDKSNKKSYTNST